MHCDTTYEDRQEGADSIQIGEQRAACLMIIRVTKGRVRDDFNGRCLSLRRTTNGRPGVAIARVREVYGIWRMTHDKKERALRVEYDGSRLSEHVVAGLLRSAGIDLLEKLALA